MNSRRSILWGFAKHYALVFKAAWQAQSQSVRQSWQREEAEFLPAVLELQESQVSPLPRWSMRVIVLFALIAVAWAFFGKMEIVATSPGKVVADQRTKVIQPLEAGQIRAIRVRDGDQVSPGDTLIELEEVSSKADRLRIQEEMQGSWIEEMQSSQFLSYLDSGRLKAVSVPEDFSAELEASANFALRGWVAEIVSKRARLMAELHQHQAEAQTAQRSIEKLQAALPLAQRRAEEYKQMSERDAVARHLYLDKEQERQNMAADLAIQQSRLVELQASIQQTIESQNQLVAEAQRTHLDRRDLSAKKRISLQQELKKAQVRVEQTVLLAPIEGVIQQLMVHTVGGVVTPAQVLMNVVPKDGSIEVEAMVQNNDVGFVHEGQEVEVKVETFPFMKYGTVPGRVEFLSQDAVLEDKVGWNFPARIRLKRPTILVEGRERNLVPGMSVVVEVKTGKRRVIEYLLNPLLQRKQESLRER